MVSRIVSAGLLALLFGCGGGYEAPPPIGGQPTPTPVPSAPTPSPTPSPVRTLAFAYTEVPGTLRVFAVDGETGGLDVVNEVMPGGYPGAPVSVPGSFVVHPSGRFLFYSYRSFPGGGATHSANLQSYEIGQDGGLTLVDHVGIEGILDLRPLYATQRWVFVHWIDSAFHSFGAWAVNAATGELQRGGDVTSGYYAYPPGSFHVNPSESWAYGLGYRTATTSNLIAYRLDARGGAAETRITPLDGEAESIEIDPAGRFLYIAFESSIPRIEVYRIDNAGVHGRVQAVRTRGSGSLRFDPSGRFLFLSEPDGIEVYGVDEGRLTGNQDARIADLAGTYVHPSGGFLYVSRRDGSLWGYTVDPGLGLLSDLGKLGRGSGLAFVGSRSDER